MFGYVRYDAPNLFLKDLVLYRAVYCGLCKSIGVSCGQIARLGLSYDMAFLSALLHNMTGQDIKIENQRCVEHCFRPQPMAATDDLTCALGALNTMLVYYKLTDDVLDEKKGCFKRACFSKSFKRARKGYPALHAIVTRQLAEQARTERERVPSPDRAADPSAVMMQDLSDELLGEKKSEATRALFYHLGKWVYLIDALDDYDGDIKKGAYNPFVLTYESKNRETLVKEHGEELSFLFDSLFYAMREALAQIPFSFNRDLTDNIILRGIPCETARIMRGEPRNNSMKTLKI